MTELVNLGDLCCIRIGKTPRRDTPRFWGPGYPWLSISDMGASRAIRATRETITPEAVSEGNLRIVEPGTVLFSFKLSIGKVGIASVPMYTNEAIAQLPIRDSSRVLPEYLYWALANVRLGGQADRAAMGSTLNLEKLHRIRFLLPPLPEQRRIADILDRADALRAKRRAAIALLDTLAQSIFLDMFGDPASNPRNWPARTLGELCWVKGGKRLPIGEEYSSRPTPYRYIRVLDLVDGRVNEASLAYLKATTQAAIRRYVVRAGDVIISIAGSTGTVAPVPASLDGANLTENAAKLTPRSPGVYEPRFVAELLSTSYMQSQIRVQTGQVTIGKLALFRIEKLHFGLPPIQLQGDFVARLDRMDRVKTTCQRNQDCSHELFNALRWRLFAGSTA